MLWLTVSCLSCFFGNLPDVVPATNGNINKQNGYWICEYCKEFKPMLYDYMLLECYIFTDEIYKFWWLLYMFMFLTAAVIASDKSLNCE